MSSSRPKTVQICLPGGNARSVRVAEITSRTVQATGEYTEDGLVVRSGSKARLEVVPSITDSVERKRENLQEVFLSEEGVLEKEDRALVFRQNYAFGFPSAAAGAVLGRSSNGWRDWTDGEGRTLDEIERG
ncbi:DUF4357 domain-containing protein [Salinibacter ruber]|uniref:DUF4357 domain-containing protein n=1 Tax=Salinibacter ruber TaxID=146919 RepID=UPI002073B48F|nr:DUF4357 domain-containing protein [Salinibacter ruber]